MYQKEGNFRAANRLIYLQLYAMSLRYCKHYRDSSTAATIEISRRNVAFCCWQWMWWWNWTLPPFERHITSYLTHLTAVDFQSLYTANILTAGQRATVNIQRRPRDTLYRVWRWLSLILTRPRLWWSRLHWPRGRISVCIALRTGNNARVRRTDDFSSEWKDFLSNNNGNNGIVVALPHPLSVLFLIGSIFTRESSSTQWGVARVPWNSLYSPYFVRSLGYYNYLFYFLITRRI